VTLFALTSAKRGNLVPYRRPRERCTNIKEEALQLPQVCVQYCIAGRCGNTPYNGKEYYHDRLCGAISHEFFCNIVKRSSEASTPIGGGDTFGTELAESRRFGSSGLNLAFDGLLFGTSLHVLTEGTRSESSTSAKCRRNIRHILQEAKGVRSSTRRLRWIDGAEACVAVIPGFYTKTMYSSYA
jgi:hypothetical protein